MDSTAIKDATKLGKSLIGEGLITINQLEHALQIQQESLQPRRLGEVLIELGYITNAQLRMVTRKYNYRLQLGAVLADAGFVTQDDLKAALAAQGSSNSLLGEILVKEEVITDEQLAIALSKQLSYPYILPDRQMVDQKLIGLFTPSFLTENIVLPLIKTGDVITLVVYNPLDPMIHQILDATIGVGRYALAVGPRSALLRVLRQSLEERKLMPGANETSDTDTKYILESNPTNRREDRQIVNIVDHIIARGIAERASDIHIDPLSNRLRVRFRVDGRLQFETDLPSAITEGVIRRIKVMSKVSIANSNDACEGHICVKDGERDYDLRVSIYPTVFGSAVTIRTLTKEVGMRELDELGFLPRSMSLLKSVLDAPAGFVLFAGPTGAGKTSSLYSCLNYLNTDGLKICTVESPVEYAIDGVAQCQLDLASGDLVNQRVRAMLHQDPDVIVLGEVNDEHTAIAAVQAALSGHKVFSTIHTEDSLGAIHRLMDMGLNIYLRSSTGVFVAAQRLVRTICLSCKKPFQPSRDLFREFRTRGLDLDNCEFSCGKGCSICHQSGFHGRTGVFEIFSMNAEIRDAFLGGADSRQIRDMACQSRRFLPLRDAAFMKAYAGETTLPEVYSILSCSARESASDGELTQDDIRFWMQEEALET